MRYSLLTLLTVVTLVGACLALIVEYWWFGVVLFLPHLLAVATITLLVRRVQRRTAAVVGGAYVMCWALTCFVDAPRARDKIQLHVSTRLFEHQSPSQRLDYNPPMWPSTPDIDTPWHFVGDESSPCPLIATVDYGVMFAKTNGEGGRLYLLCFCGYSRIVHVQFHWFS